MGTDIYLSWDGMSEEDKKMQLGGFAVNAGSVGYLRASIGMVRENRFLRMVFPESFWKGDADVFDFIKEGTEVLPDAVGQYVGGIELPETESSKKQVELGEMVMRKLQEASKSGDVDIVASSLSEKERLKFARSVVSFFVLGAEKQEKGLNPRVVISW